MSNYTTTIEGTGLVLTCVSCRTTWEPVDEDPHSFVCPTLDCASGGLLTARLADGPEPSSAPTAGPLGTVEATPAGVDPQPLGTHPEWCDRDRCEHYADDNVIFHHEAPTPFTTYLWLGRYRFDEVTGGQQLPCDERISVWEEDSSAIEELTPDEARRLAARLVELADRAEGGAR